MAPRPGVRAAAAPPAPGEAGQLGGPAVPAHAARAGARATETTRLSHTAASEPTMNDAFREVKDRMRKLDAALARGGVSNAAFAQAVSAARRVMKKGDRSRAPSPEIRALLEKAEALERELAAG